MSVKSFMRSLWPFSGDEDGAYDTAYADDGADVATRRRPPADRGSFPAFLSSAIDRPGIGSRGERDDILRARLILRDLFTPTQPVTERAGFAGRTATLNRLIELIEEHRSHVVLYGERGIGKTSLLHVLADVARESNYIVAYATCGANARFDDIFRSVLRSVPTLYNRRIDPNQADAEGAGQTFADLLPARPFDARELADLCSDITGTRVLVVLDEYDRIVDPDFRQSIAELIKNLSDRAARVQLLLAGVAFNLQELIGYVPSIRRNVIGLPMPRLGVDEVRELIGIGESGGGVRFDPAVIERVGELSNGSPYLARLLSHHASMRALDDGRLTVSAADLAGALDKVVEESEGRVTRQAARQMRRLTRDEDRQALAAAARASTTPDGWFTVRDVAQQMPGTSTVAIGAAIDRIAGQSEVLEREDDGEEVRFRFRDEALPTYLWMAVARDQLLGERTRG